MSEETLKASIGLGNLKHALQITSQAKSKAAVIPILQGVRMEQIEAGLAIEATDLDVFIRVVLPELGGPATPIITPAEKFHAWTKLLDGETVSLSATSSRATVKCGRAKAVLPLSPPGNWPSNDVFALKGEGVTLTQGALARALSFAQIAVSTEASRYTLNGIQVQGDGTQLHVISTDAHCLMLYTVPCAEKISLLLPGRLVGVLLSLLKDADGGIDLTYSETRILASIDADTKLYVAAPRMNGQFPNWQAVFPREKRTDVAVQVADLGRSLERCALLSDEKNGTPVDLTFLHGELTIHSANAEHGEADEVMPYTGTLREDGFKTRINATFLRDLARKLTGELIIAIPNKGTDPMLFKAAPAEGETLGYVVMPMRLA